MLIRFGGGIAGIKEYLETGRKQGRKESREELDERVILYGNLELVDQIIGSKDGGGDRYLHITLSFKEDHVDRAILEAAAKEFQEFAFAAYEVDEFCYYAEAHLPRIKTTSDQKTKATVRRKPHIHIVIPKVNLLTHGYLNPFGLIDRTVNYIDAFQESFNLRHGLASPKDNVRLAATGKAEIFSRWKGDDFKSSRRALKASLASELMNREIDTFESFVGLAAEYGEVTVNPRSVQEFVHLVPYGEDKGTNLRDRIFTRAFIELPMAEKRARLSDPKSNEYVEMGQGKPPAADLEKTIAEWRGLKANEIKYMNSGNKKAFSAYQKAGIAEQKCILAELATKYYRKYRKDSSLVKTHGIGNEGEQEKTSVHPIEQPQMAEGAVPGNPISQRIQDIAEHRRQQQSENMTEFQKIKRYLSAQQLLVVLASSHGLEIARYRVVKGLAGGDRIVCGNRKLNVCDFLTKEMNLLWKEASKLLRQQWEMQSEEELEVKKSEVTNDYLTIGSYELMNEIGMVSSDVQGNATTADHSQQSLFDPYTELQAQFLERRFLILDDQLLQSAQRRSALSILAMDHIYAEVFFQCSDHVMFDTEGKDDFLRRKKTTMLGVDSRILDYLKSLSSKSMDNGDVQWYRQGRPILLDTGDSIKLAMTDLDTIEIAVMLAIKKFGTKLELKGSIEFQVAVAKIAAKADQEIILSDPEMQTILEVERERLFLAFAKVPLQQPVIENLANAKTLSVKLPKKPKAKKGLELDWSER